MKKKKGVKRRRSNTENQAEDSRVQLDGFRTGPDYLIGPGSYPEFDYSQMVGPSIFKKEA